MYFLHTPLMCLALALLPSLGLCGGHTAASAGVYVAEDEASVVLSDRPWLQSARLLVPHETPSPQAAHALRPFDDIVALAAKRHQLPSALLHAVIAVESGYAPMAVSSRGAMGLMQLMPGTARSLGVERPFDPAQNIQGGAHHLRRLLDDFNGNTRLALAAYNAGAGAVRRHGGKVPPFAETQAYVPRVLDEMRRMTPTPDPRP